MSKRGEIKKSPLSAPRVAGSIGGPKGPPGAGGHLGRGRFVLPVDRGGWGDGPKGPSPPPGERLIYFFYFFFFISNKRQL